MGDVIRAVLVEIAAEPVRFVAEAVQSLILIGLIIAFGRPPVRRRLAARQARIAAALDEADAAEREAGRLHEEAAALATARPAEAPVMAPDVERAALDEGIEAEAGQVVAQVRETIEREKEAIRRAAADRLVRLTTEVARHYLDEMVGDEERRAATRRAILESLAEVERSDAGP
jgi:F0F1-type ATP synthase membrane subunit b/b'